MIYSSSYVLGYLEYGSANYILNRQLKWYGLSVFLFIFVALFPYRNYRKLAPLLVTLSILLLILVLVPGVGVVRNFSQRWIGIGSFTFQPTEMIKLFMLIYFASFYSKGEEKLASFKTGVLPPLIILSVMFILILKQPDLGSAALILFACGLIVICSGVKGRHLMMLGSIGIAIIVYFISSTSYRMERVTSFMDPFADPAGTGYQLVNSYIGVQIAKETTDMFGKLLAIGITFQMTTQVIINLGAVSGLMPITGVPLPLISYGGSSLLITLISLGILTNISIKNQKSTV